VLADRAAPYLLARVRWPDVAQAITAGCPDWLDDPGLFDLPYDPIALRVSFAQAVSVAAGWGRQIRAEPAEGVLSFIRRMPSNWSDLSPVERHAFGLDSVRRRRGSARRLRRVRSSQAKIGAGAAATALRNGHAGPFAGEGPGADVYGPAANGRSEVANVTSGVAAERRHHVRVRVDGRAHILCGYGTISAALVDLSEGGVRCVLPDASPMLAAGTPLDGPFLLEAEVTGSRICLGGAGRISWNRSIRAGTHFGVVFGELDEGETEGVQRFLVSAGRRQVSR
jgi:hypothetical protein